MTTKKEQDLAATATTKPVAPASPEEGESAVEATAGAMQKLTDEAEDKGFYGTSPDKTPRENYTVEGVIAGKPTPENTELEKQ